MLNLNQSMSSFIIKRVLGYLIGVCHNLQLDLNTLNSPTVNCQVSNLLFQIARKWIRYIYMFKLYNTCTYYVG